MLWFRTDAWRPLPRARVGDDWRGGPGRPVAARHRAEHDVHDTAPELGKLLKHPGQAGEVGEWKAWPAGGCMALSRT